MGESNFQAPVAAGTVWGGPRQDFGYTEFVQFATVAFNATLVSQVILYLPYSPPQYQPRITSVTVDVTTAYNSATSAYLTVGKTSGGFDFMGSASLVDVKGGTNRLYIHGGASGGAEKSGASGGLCDGHIGRPANGRQRYRHTPLHGHQHRRHSDSDAVGRLHPCRSRQTSSPRPSSSMGQFPAAASGSMRFS